MNRVLLSLVLAATLVGCGNDPKKEAKRGNDKLATASSLINEGLKEHGEANQRSAALLQSKGAVELWEEKEITEVANKFASAREKYVGARTLINDALNIDSKNENVRMSNRGEVERIRNGLTTEIDNIDYQLSLLQKGLANKKAGKIPKDRRSNGSARREGVKQTSLSDVDEA